MMNLKKKHATDRRRAYFFGGKILPVLCMGTSSTDIHEHKKAELSQKVIPKTGHF